jgi:hypothetical protein
MTRPTIMMMVAPRLLTISLTISSVVSIRELRRSSRGSWRRRGRSEHRPCCSGGPEAWFIHPEHGGEREALQGVRRQVVIELVFTHRRPGRFPPKSSGRTVGPHLANAHSPTGDTGRVPPLPPSGPSPSSTVRMPLPPLRPWTRVVRGSSASGPPARAQGGRWMRCLLPRLDALFPLHRCDIQVLRR